MAFLARSSATPACCASLETYVTPSMSCTICKETSRPCHRQKNYLLHSEINLRTPSHDASKLIDRNWHLAAHQQLGTGRAPYLVVAHCRRARKLLILLQVDGMCVICIS
jgi:hypothetical protein